MTTPGKIDGIKMGFTGSREGLTKAQSLVLGFIFKNGNNYITEFHHGLCRGSDEQAHDIVREPFWECKIIGHPPINHEFYVAKDCDEMRAALPYLMRNHAIVDETDQLVACPAGPEIMRSGTWSTVRYARRQGKPITIITPDGEVFREERRK